MPTLLERSLELHKLAGQLAAAGTEKALFEKLTTRAAQVKDARNELQSAERAVRLLTTRGVRPATLPRASNALKAKGPVVRQQLRDDWRAFADDRTVPTNFVEPVKVHASKLRDAALAAWQAHVDSGQPAIRAALITALAAAGFQAQCARLQQLQAEVADLRGSCPSSVADFDRLDELKAAIQRIWGELQGVPANVIEFLRKAARREAKVTDLTPGIRTWLDDRAMLDQLRIGLG